MNTKNILQILTAFLLSLQLPVLSQLPLKYNENNTPEWDEVIRMYEQLDRSFREARLVKAGMTDAGKPLHLFIISKDQYFSAEEARRSGKQILFINNGIHPGESCGIDASLKLADELLSGRDSSAKWLDKTIICIIPVFNVGGALNRGSYNRANQNGPEEHGFRGNALNLDLNRDFIKLDSENATSLVKLLREWDPDLFIDTHTSNGADYQYTITLIASHPQKMEASMSRFQEDFMLPWLYHAMAQTDYEMTPYVANYAGTPDKGIEGFMDYPRYTSGYVSMFNTYAFTVETHMFKDYADRVLSTWEFLRKMLCFSGQYAEEIRESRVLAKNSRQQKTDFVLEWAPDTSRCDSILFKGYRAKYKESNISGAQRLYYDRSEPWSAMIPYYNFYKPVISIEAPYAYILPQGWKEVTERLKLNGVEMKALKRDTSLLVDVYYIDDEKTTPAPYNSHYWHYKASVHSEKQEIKYYAGDLVIPVHQAAAEYIVQTLEPQGYDSFFSWNFFDGILSRKEYFSPYVFEETAEEILENDPELKDQFRNLQVNDTAFAANPYLQLRYIYEHSPYNEKSYRRYPVTRTEKNPFN